MYEDVSELALPPRILRGVRRGKKRVLHAECDAVANAIQQMGEEAAFASFAASTAWIVELAGDVGFSDAPPCPKCTCLLRALGVRRIRHSTSTGVLASISWPCERPELLSCDIAYMPLLYACQSKKLRCRRLEEILRNLSSENPVK